MSKLPFLESLTRKKLKERETERTEKEEGSHETGFVASFSAHGWGHQEREREGLDLVLAEGMAAPLFALRKGSKSSAVRSNDFSSSVSEVGVTTTDNTWTGSCRRPFTLRSSLDLHETHSEVGFAIRENSRAGAHPHHHHLHPLLHPKSTIHHSNHNQQQHSSLKNHRYHHLWNKHKILSSSVSTMDHNHHNSNSNHHNWASSRWENETVITANTSAHSGSFDIDLNLVGKSNNHNLSPEELISLRCQQYSGSIIAGLVSICAFLSPILMIILPSLSSEWRITECTSDCDALFISFAFKLVLLLIGTWLVFVKQPRANLPRIFLYRAIVLALIFLLVISYWLFFVVRAADRRFADVDIPYQNLLSSYSVPLLENLLWVHYLAVILMEVRHQQSRFYVKVVRSPDGVSKSFTLGQMCIQRAAVSVLDKYYSDFAQYNPHLDEISSASVSSRKKNKTLNGNNPAITSTIAERGSILGNGSNNMSGGGLKYYEVDAINGNGSAGGTNANIAPSEVSTRFESHPSTNCRSSHGSRKREEQIERRKRRLVSCTLSAFNRIRSADINSSPTSSATPLEIAQAVFPSIDRSLRKYLRATKQQHLYTQEAILKHLSLILTYGLSAQTFLEKYLSSDPVQNYDLKPQAVQTWDLFSDVLVSRSVRDGTTIVLRQDEISLLVTFSSLPFFNLKEVVPDSKNNRFVLTVNSESSVWKMSGCIGQRQAAKPVLSGEKLLQKVSWTQMASATWSAIRKVEEQVFGNNLQELLANCHQSSSNVICWILGRQLMPNPGVDVNVSQETCLLSWFYKS